MQMFDTAGTAALLDHASLVTTLEATLRDYQRGLIDSPERLAVRCGADGQARLLSMPCSAPDLLVHKLLTLYPTNPHLGLPTIQGFVTAFEAVSGTPLFALDGPTVTARRTAAISMVGLRHLLPHTPARAAIIGTGAQALAHAEMLLALYPGLEITVRGTSAAKEHAFCAQLSDAGGRVSGAGGAPLEADVIIAVTTSHVPVYDEPPRPGRLIIGAGAYRLDMAEIGARTLAGSQIYVDDPIGAPGEAGDLVAAGTSWDQVRPLATSLDKPPDFSRPVVLKSVGCAAWDLAACRAARARLERRG